LRFLNGAFSTAGAELAAAEGGESGAAESAMGGGIEADSQHE